MESVRHRSHWRACRPLVALSPDVANKHGVKGVFHHGSCKIKREGDPKYLSQRHLCTGSTLVGDGTITWLEIAYRGGLYCCAPASARAWLRG